MASRKARFHPGLGLERYPYEPALATPLVANFFHPLGIGVSLLDYDNWHPIYEVPDVLSFEREHGVEHLRVTYNDRCMRQALREGRAVLGEHAGFSDLFLPIMRGTSARGVLATGPFSTEPPTGGEIVERWRRLTGKHGHLADPEFALYFSTTLSTPLLDPPRLRAFKTLTTCFAALIAGQGKPEALLARARSMKRVLDEITFVPRMWDAARAMVDPRSGRTWASPHLAVQRRALNIERLPECALVGLIESARENTVPTDELVRRDAFQRAAARFARASGDIACGKVGNHGIMFLLPAERTEALTRRRLVLVAERAAAMAQRQFQLKLHVGVGLLTSRAALPQRYQAALAAAENALARGAGLTHASTLTERPAHALRALRAQLGKLAQEPPLEISAHFDRYLELVAARSGFRVDVAQAHLEAGFERLTEPLLSSGALAERTFEGLSQELEQETEAAATVADLLAAYRRIVADLEQGLQKPAEAHQERSLRRAATFIQEHLSEPLSLAQVARVAGFAETYFSRLFKERERTTFGRYVRDLRIERAKQLLNRTSLSVDRVGKLSGFSSTQYFHHVFRRLVGTTPVSYRSEAAQVAYGRA